MNISSFLIGYQAGKKAGGGSSADVRYVTFMSYDGSVEYGKKAVAYGDDCADPIARGVFETPTRESDVQYDYTFYGWTTEVNGAYDSSALKSVTDDRTVYANYISALRYYTITYYDGETVLKTESLAYGSTPSYTPVKEGYKFNGWEPEFATVTGDASYYAQFTKQVTFETGSLEDIAALSESGEASTTFAVGDTRTITFTYADGSTESGVLRIIDFDYDDLADGSGKAGITAELVGVLTKYGSSVWTPGDSAYSGTPLDTKLREEVKPLLPADLRAVMKTVTKKGGFDSNSCDVDIFPLAYSEIFQLSAITNQNFGDAYEYYVKNASQKPSLWKKYDSSGNVVQYPLRTCKVNPNSWYYVGTDGYPVYQNIQYVSGGLYMSFAICI